MTNEYTFNAHGGILHKYKSVVLHLNAHFMTCIKYHYNSDGSI